MIAITTNSSTRVNPLDPAAGVFVPIAIPLVNHTIH